MRHSSLDQNVLKTRFKYLGRIIYHYGDIHVKKIKGKK